MRLTLSDAALDARELTFTVEGTGARELRLEVSRSARIRLSAGARRLMWARVCSGFYGVTFARSEDASSPGFLPPFRADEARRHQDRAWWMRRIASGLAESPITPLRPGRWQLAHLVADASDGACFVHPRAELRSVGPLTVLDLLEAAAAPSTRDDDFGGHGSWSVWPLRRPSDADEARVKAWRKHAVEGTLPPVVLWSVSGLQSHLLLDGHDRLVAARSAGVTPDVVLLWRVHETPPTEERMARAAHAYTSQFERHPGGRQALNTMLERAFAPTRAPADAFAIGRSDMDDEWDREVASVLTAEDADALCRADF